MCLRATACVCAGMLGARWKWKFGDSFRPCARVPFGFRRNSVFVPFLPTVARPPEESATTKLLHSINIWMWHRRRLWHIYSFQIPSDARRLPALQSPANSIKLYLSRRMEDSEILKTTIVQTASITGSTQTHTPRAWSLNAPKIVASRRSNRKKKTLSTFTNKMK